MSTSLEDLIDAVYFVLEPHSAYISKGDDEDTRYFVPSEVLEALAWIGLHVCIPILTGVSTAVVAERLKSNKPSETEKALELQQNELAELKTELNKIIMSFDSDRLPAENESAIAKATLSEILAINGWPEEAATNDAAAVVAEIRGQLWGRTKDD